MSQDRVRYIVEGVTAYCYKCGARLQPGEVVIRANRGLIHGHCVSYDHKALTVECPRCHVAAGESCVERTKTKSHRARWAAAAREANKTSS